MNHPIVLRVQTYNSLEQIEIPVIHNQILHAEAIQKWEDESRNRHDVFSDIVSSCEDYSHQQDGQ
jgi:hypothetical protein